ncbi:hypothetical protein ACFL6S_21150 [Candidatus Poribacteria bacterium]
MDKIELDIQAGGTYNLKAILAGQKYQCFVDGEIVVEYEDADAFRESGMVGIISYAVHPNIDGLKVTLPSSTSV